MLAMLQRLLTKSGYTVHPARDADEALRLAAENRCDLIVSDIGMPGQDGLGLMRRLKQQYELKGIALSGFAREADVAAARDAGFERHIAKPVDFPQLISTIKELVG